MESGDEDTGHNYSATIMTHRDGAYAVSEARFGMIVFITGEGETIGSGNVSFGKSEIETGDLMFLLAQLDIVRHRILRLVLKGTGIKDYLTGERVDD